MQPAFNLDLKSVQIRLICVIRVQSPFSLILPREQNGSITYFGLQT